MKVLLMCKRFWLGFLLCYVIAGFCAAYTTSQMKFTTKLAVATSTVMWLPNYVIPEKITHVMYGNKYFLKLS